MANKKQERQHLSDTGTILFDGKMWLNIAGHTYQVRTDYGGFRIREADQNREVVVLIARHMPYNELDTGFFVRAKEYDKQYSFGLKPTKQSKMWSIYHYADVVAWGYVDESRPVDIDNQPGLAVKFRDNGTDIQSEVSWPKDGNEQLVPLLEETLRDCCNTFAEFHKQHKEFREMHFYTEHTEWEPESDEKESE